MRTIDGMELTGDWPITKYDGCGKCLLGGVRLSRKSEATYSPEKQREICLETAAAEGAHIIGWAVDLEVSGATDPFTRPKLGPWLKDLLGPYDGLISSSVDRIGRDVFEGLNLARYLQGTNRLLFTAGHLGPWNLSDNTDEGAFLLALFGAQMEHRAIKKRNQDSVKSARKAGRKRSRHMYGFRYVRLTPRGAIDHQEFDAHSQQVITNVAARILAAEDYEVTPAKEAARLNREGELSPRDYEALMYGREPKGYTWTAEGVRGMLVSYAALGYLTHDDKPVLGEDGQPIRLSEGLWDEATREALIEKLAPRRKGPKGSKGKRLMSGRISCGNCGTVHYLTGRPAQWRCTGRVRGLRHSALCEPSPGMLVTKVDAAVTDYFLTKFGNSPVMKRVFDPGNGHAARIAELEDNRRRLREDRAAGLYDSADDAEWFRSVYGRFGAELDVLKAEPVREAGLIWVPTGETIGDQWEKADPYGRREMLISYGIRAVMYPQGHSPRLWIHNLDQAAEAEVIAQVREREQALAQAEEGYELLMRAQQDSTWQLGRMLLGRPRIEELTTSTSGDEARTLALIEQELRTLDIDTEVDAFQYA